LSAASTLAAALDGIFGIRWLQMAIVMARHLVEVRHGVACLPICGFEEAEGATLGFSSSGGRACLIAHLGSDPEHQEKLQAQWLGG
jgi:hypothetical protein